MFVNRICRVALLALCISNWSCQQQTTSSKQAAAINTLFTALAPEAHGIDFINSLTYTEDFNPYIFRNFYNGGGVGVGDINNDGLPDLYFCGNTENNKLYLNKGNFQFEDITQKAGVACPNVWSSGVSFADVNGDGWLDIYVCKSGDPKGENRYNELFINQQDGTFIEKAQQWGIADKGLSTHAAFFDYDKDGDLDCYLLNNSIRSVGGYDLREGQREIRDTLGGNKLYRNDGNRFTDVSAEAGIYGSAIGFGLGVTIGDVNGDTWQDIYVSNDFFERDYLYINNQDGSFSEELPAQMREISLSSMGADMADLNNDGYPEVFVTDMLPEGDARMKTKTAFENWDKYQLNVRTGYHHQFTRNALQLNNGNGTFSEIGRLADVFATDWSWGALLADFDLDGNKDIFVANGIFKDLTDQDYINYYSDPAVIRRIMEEKGSVITELIDGIPSEAVPNYLFKNQGDYQFTNVAEEWGLVTPSFSNGSAYADFDLDGDLDLVINNVNMPPFLYRNNADTLLQENHFISLSLKGIGSNLFALSSQVRVYAGGQTYYQELAPMRGFQSCVDTRLSFGIGTATIVDSIVVHWPDNRLSVLRNIKANQLIELDQARTAEVYASANEATPQHTYLKSSATMGIDYEHKENKFEDFDRDHLLYHMLSAEGPAVAKGDANGDGREDLYLGGAKDQVGELWLQQANGRFRKDQQPLWAADAAAEDTDAVFFDADGDGDQDLYVASGGYEFSNTRAELVDRLYLNDGRGRFERSSQVLPANRFEVTACVRPADFDQDGDLDLFVGIRNQPSLYGVPVNGHLLENDGKGQFQVVSQSRASQLQKIGMITDAQWADIDQDQDLDLIVVGDWMPVQVFKNEGGTLDLATAEAGLEATAGFWNTLRLVDIDGDGDQDIIAGNHGLNSRITASQEQPASLYVNDFDQNGRAEQIICVYNGEASYPMALRHDLVKQMPVLNKKYLKYASYKEQTIEDIFPPEVLERSVKWEATMLETTLFVNDGTGIFRKGNLPVEAQFAPIHAITTIDLNADGQLDLLLGGNFYRAKPEIGIYDATYGISLLNKGDGQFEALPAAQSGFQVKGATRAITQLDVNGEQVLLAIRNNGPIAAFKMNQLKQ
ncbi:MAG: VCBS repeat-containing protein [Bacteroidota bacterium]